MKWLRFRHGGQEGFGQLEGQTVRVCEGSMFEQPRITDRQLALDEIEWLAPCEPRLMVGLWNNFHALAQKNGWATPAEPLYFFKSPASLCAHGANIAAAPDAVGRIAYEGELAIVIGKPTHRITAEQAHEHIFGYTCANDVTAMELLNRDPAFPQWARAKSLPGFGALGPWIDTEFNPQAATLRTRIGGRERQNYALSDMIFSPLQIVAALSQDLQLMPGDVILCGTSLGVMPMKPGSAVEVDIDGLGVLANTYG